MSPELEVIISATCGTTRVIVCRFILSVSFLLQYEHPKPAQTSIGIVALLLLALTSVSAIADDAGTPPPAQPTAKTAPDTGSPKLIPVIQIIRPTIPWLQSPEGKSGWGDIDLQHVFVPESHPWGTLGFGYTATFPTADHRVLGACKYQAGTAATLIYYGIKNWQIGGTMTQS